MLTWPPSCADFMNCMEQKGHLYFKRADWVVSFEIYLDLVCFVTLKVGKDCLHG